MFGKAPVPDSPPDAEPAPATPTPSGPDPAILAQEDEERLAAALASGAPQALTDCVLNAHSTKARQRAAQAVHDPDHLRELIRLTRGGKDNSVYRILTTKRDALLAAARARAARQAEIDALLTSLARRARLPYDPLYEPSLALFKQEWTSLAADASPEAGAQVAAHFATMQTVIEHHREALAAEARRLTAAAEAAAVAQREPEPVAPVEIEAAPAPMPQEAPTEPPVKAEAPTVSAQPLIALLRQAQAALDQGGTARAQRLRTTLAEKLAQPPPLPVWFERQLQLLDAKLAELKDWKTFTVEPKRAELVQRMRSLIASEISPEQLAQHIRRLQDEWRTLHRGAGDDTSADAESFREATKKAYEPCKQHFAQQAAVRQANQKQRESILERLAAYTATLEGDAADWRQVARTILEARQEWREYAPVDNAVAPALQDRLRTALGELQGRLDAEYARNVAAKRDLIERARQLLTLPDTRRAIDGAKELQREWRTIGLVPQNHSNALWDEFRGHCDAVFQRSAQEAAAYGATLDASQSRARALCEELEGIAALTGEELRTAMRTLDDRRNEFDALGLPRQSARDLRQRFIRAAQRCADAVHQERHAAVQRAAMALFDAAAAIRAYALAQLRADGVEAARAQAAAAVAALAGAPKAARTVLEQQFSKAAAGEVSGDLSANEKELRLLCVRAELVTDIATPESDLGLRRDYQMRRLLETKGLGADIGLADLEELTLEWFTVGPVDPSIESALRARFDRCRNTAPGAKPH
jgi:hypothetical protein